MARAEGSGTDMGVKEVYETLSNLISVVRDCSSGVAPRKIINNRAEPNASTPIAPYNTDFPGRLTCRTRWRNFGLDFNPYDETDHLIGTFHAIVTVIRIRARQTFDFLPT